MGYHSSEKTIITASPHSYVREGMEVGDYNTEQD